MWRIFFAIIVAVELIRKIESKSPKQIVANLILVLSFVASFFFEKYTKGNKKDNMIINILFGVLLLLACMVSLN